MSKIIRHDVDLLKAVAIVAVVMYHFFDLTNASMLTSVSLFSGGYVGVDIFLVISGYLITSGIFYLNQNFLLKISMFAVSKELCLL